MNIIQLRDLYRQSESLADQTITICGWVRSNRDSKSFGFLSIHDGTFFQPVQVVYDDKLANYDIVRKIKYCIAVVIVLNIKTMAAVFAARNFRKEGLILMTLRHRSG